MTIQNVSRLSPVEPRGREVDPLSLKVLQHVSRYIGALHSYPERSGWRPTLRRSPSEDRIHDEPHVTCHPVRVPLQVMLIVDAKRGTIFTTCMDERYQRVNNFWIPVDKREEWSNEFLS
jgi:hypothetical protein